MDKLKMHTPNLTDENFKKLAALFPNAVTETINENGEVVGLASSQTRICVEKGENTVELTMDPHCLAPGKYFVKLTFFSLNENGTAVFHDVVTDAFGIEKLQDRHENNDITWNQNWWGSVMFPEIDIG